MQVATELDEALQLRARVSECAKQELRCLPRDERQDVEPGGAWDGRLLDYALDRWTFFECSDCSDVFCGGRRQCGVGEPGSRRLCQRCSSVGRACTKHGTDHLDWKCKYCCSLAAWFCWGTTHMCDRCHNACEQGTLSWSSGSGCTADVCPLRIRHGPHGEELCLGCALCRSEADLTGRPSKPPTSDGGGGWFPDIFCGGDRRNCSY